LEAPRDPAWVGVLLNPSLNSLLDGLLQRIDHLAVIPDRGWIDHGASASPRFQWLPDALARIGMAAARRPVVLHGIGLSIGSARGFDRDYALSLIDTAKQVDAPWVSEHLSFSRAGDSAETNAAMMLPLPYDVEVLDMLVPRIGFITERLQRPFLLENNVAYGRYLDQDMDEAEFLNMLCRRSGCGLLLDLHNLHTNAVNHGFAARDFLDRLDASHVIEVHVAGGVPMMGFHTDSHTGPVLEPVWDLLAEAAPRLTGLRAVTFEFHESSFGQLGEAGIGAQIARARAILADSATTRREPSHVADRLPERVG
jgi:uncharacterized protein (UPF0276 family)